jgi:tetratricopeptide (TPR) repeat protein
MPVSKKTKTQDLDFQMQFYEGIIRENPGFAEALIALGEIYTKKGQYEKGLKVDRRLLELRPDNPIVHYNLACSLSLLGDITGSFKAIKRAVELGYDDFGFMTNDPDLSNLRRDKRFLQFYEKAKKDPSRVPDAKRTG